MFFLSDDHNTVRKQPAILIIQVVHTINTCLLKLQYTPLFNWLLLFQSADWSKVHHVTKGILCTAR